MHTIPYRRWHPLRSPIRIEFPEDLTDQARAETRHDHDRGFLFGLRQSHEIRALCARRTADPQPSGMTAVGIYVSRERGEVFLTDADLAFMEQHGAGVALVLAGTKGGFFVREDDGTIQAVRSHEEFAVAGPPASARPVPQRSMRWWGTAAALFAGPVAAVAYFGPLRSAPPLELHVHERHGQLLVYWDPAALDAGGRLEFASREGRVVVDLPRSAGSATHPAPTGGVEIRLTTETRSGSAHWP